MAFDPADFQRKLASALQDGDAVPMPSQVEITEAPLYRWSLVPTRDVNTGLIVSVDLAPVERVHVV